MSPPCHAVALAAARRSISSPAARQVEEAVAPLQGPTTNSSAYQCAAAAAAAADLQCVDPLWPGAGEGEAVLVEAGVPLRAANLKEGEAPGMALAVHRLRWPKTPH